MGIRNDLRMPFKSGNMLIQLIIVNVAIFVFLNIIRIGLFFSGYKEPFLSLVLYGNWVDYLAMPMRFGEFIHKPWTILTYSFTQVDLPHIFWNMLVLYFFGTVIQEFIGFSRTLAIYIYGAIIGGVLTLLLHSTVPVLMKEAGILLGASGSVMALVVAAATLVPDRKVMLLFFGEIKLVYIALAYVIIDLIGVTYIDGVGHICHLGGALAGFLFVTSLKRGMDWSKPVNAVFYGITGLFRKRKGYAKMKVVKNTTRSTSSSSGTSSKTSAKPSRDQVQKRIDVILDKISKGGYESLTKEEKDYLFTHGKDI